VDINILFTKSLLLPWDATWVKRRQFCTRPRSFIQILNLGETWARYIISFSVEPRFGEVAASVLSFAYARDTEQLSQFLFHFCFGARGRKRKEAFEPRQQQRRVASRDSRSAQSRACSSKEPKIHPEAKIMLGQKRVTSFAQRTSGWRSEERGRSPLQKANTRINCALWF